MGTVKKTAEENHQALVDMHHARGDRGRPLLLTDRTVPDQSDALDALVSEAKFAPEGHECWASGDQLEYWMRRAFKLAVDTELEALATIYDTIMGGMQRHTSEAMGELDRKFTASRSWIKIKEKKT
jgi:hypothetical protein